MRTQTPTDLVECQAMVERLEEERAHLQQENEHLREASRAFGDLAERLNLTLRAKRRGLTDQGLGVDSASSATTGKSVSSREAEP